MDLLWARSKLNACLGSHNIVINFLEKLQMSRVLPNDEERAYWRLIARSREPPPAKERHRETEDRNWLNALQEVIEWARSALVELQDCGELLDDWNDWGE